MEEEPEPEREREREGVRARLPRGGRLLHSKGEVDRPPIPAAAMAAIAAMAALPRCLFRLRRRLRRRRRPFELLHALLQLGVLLPQRLELLLGDPKLLGLGLQTKGDGLALLGLQPEISLELRLRRLGLLLVLPTACAHVEV